MAPSKNYSYEINTTLGGLLIIFCGWLSSEDLIKSYAWPSWYSHVEQKKKQGRKDKTDLIQQHCKKVRFATSLALCMWCYYENFEKILSRYQKCSHWSSLLLLDIRSLLGHYPHWPCAAFWLTFLLTPNHLAALFPIDQCTLVLFHPYFWSWIFAKEDSQRFMQD